MLDRDKAKAIICEIICQSGGRFEGKTRLYKAFYFAHFRYAEMKMDSLEELSEWPIVRMPNGPGIDEGTALLAELEAEGHIASTTRQAGDYKENAYEYTEEYPFTLTPDEKQAITYAIHTLGKHSGSKWSRWSHEHCNTWKHMKDGERINIYHDFMSEAEFLRRREVAEWAEEAVEEIFKDET